jgi:4-hydroxymandelate oxidase
VDGGIVSGADVFVALALGAAGAMVGRPILWGLAAAGAQGVQRVLDGYRDELDHAMGLAGVATIGDFGRDLLV